MTDRQIFSVVSNPPGANHVHDVKESHANMHPATNRGGLFRHRKTCYPPRISASEKIWAADLDWAWF